MDENDFTSLTVSLNFKILIKELCIKKKSQFTQKCTESAYCLFRSIYLGRPILTKSSILVWGAEDGEIVGLDFMGFKIEISAPKKGVLFLPEWLGGGVITYNFISALK